MYSEDPVLRTSDAERDHAAAALREHATVGRLTLEELDHRVEAALAARTQGELNALFADLPRPVLRRSGDHMNGRALGVRVHTIVYLSVSLMMIVIWTTTGAGDFWPMWPMLGWGIGVTSHTAACSLGSGRHRSRR